MAQCLPNKPCLGASQVWGWGYSIQICIYAIRRNINFQINKTLVSRQHNIRVSQFDGIFQQTLPIYVASPQIR